MSRRRPIIVTAASLIALGACGDQVAAFRATFGESVTVPRRASARRALASRVAEARLDCGWYARRVLSLTAWRAYDEATARQRPIATSDAAATGRQRPSPAGGSCRLRVARVT